MTRKDKSICVQYLAELRKRWLAKNDMFRLDDGWNTLSDQRVQIGGREYWEYVWSQKTADQTLIVFEVVRDAFLGSVHYCLGVELLEHGAFRFLVDKDLWEQGIP